MIVCHNTFPLVLYIVPQRKATTSLEKYPFFCYNRATKEEYVAPEISPGLISYGLKLRLKLKYATLVASIHRIEDFLWQTHIRF